MALALNNLQRLKCHQSNIFLGLKNLNGFSHLRFLYLMAYQLLFRLFNVKAILLEEQLWYYLTHSWEDEGVHTFPKGICPKVNVIVRLEYELAYYDSAVHRFNHYTPRTPPEKYLFLTLLDGGGSDTMAKRSVTLLH